jgi:rhodanese-related sulfurtransferase
MSFPELAALEANADPSRYRIVDVREEHEFRGPLGFIEGAELVPLSQVADNAEKLASSRPLLIVCRSGKRSAAACEQLQKLGVPDVTNLAGGMIGWNQAELPVVRIELNTPSLILGSLTAWLAQVTAASADAARSRLDALLAEPGVSAAGTTPEALGPALDALEHELRKAGSPPDLEITMRAYRADLAAL